LDPLTAVPGPWPALLSTAGVPGDYDPAGPLAMLVGLPLAGALFLLLMPRRWAPLAARWSFLWALPGAAFLVAALWFGAAGGGPDAVRWLERIPGGGGLVLSIWNLVPVVAVGIATPLALALPEPRTKGRGRAGWLLVFASSTLAALLGADPGVVAIGWLGGTWALFFLIGEEDAAGQGQKALGAFVAHAVATMSVLVAGVAPGFGAGLLLAGAIRLGIPPFHGVLARAYQTLPTGGLLLCGVGLIATGLRAMHDGALLATPGDARSGAALTLAVGFAGLALWGGFATLPEDDLKRRLAGFVSTQGAVWAAFLTGLAPVAGRALVGRWAVTALLAFVALVAAYARLFAFTRTGDLRAYGGLARGALLRSTLLGLAFAGLALGPALAAPGRLVQALQTLAAAQPLIVLGVLWGGAFGLLAIGLAIARTVRGAAPTPVPSPDLSAREWAFVAGLFVLVFALARLDAPNGLLTGFWPETAGAAARTAGAP
jgi:hypothetical protein